MDILAPEIIRKKPIQNFNILIVDDCQVSSKYLSQLIEHLGYPTPDLVTSYQQAIKSCVKRAYSLLFIDYHLEQTLNGSELYDLLKEKGFIQPYTRVITVSGDNTTQTVLSTLSKGNGDYLCKPINKSILSNKMTHAHQEYCLFKQLYSLKNNKSDTELQRQAIEFAKTNNINELDQYLIDLLMLTDKKKLLSLCQEPEFSTRKNYLLAQLEVENELELIPKEELLKKTQQLCEQYSLFTPAFDFLASLYINQKYYEDALLSANTALNLTPSVPSRALQVIKLALSCNNKSSFLKATHLLANHLPIADPNWCSYVIECLNYYDAYIQKAQSESDINQLILDQKNFIRRSEYRLTPIQRGQLNIMFNLSMAKHLIEEGDIIQAKQNTLKSLHPYYNNLHQLSSVTLVETLYLLSFFGEIWLIEKINEVLKQKKKIDNYARHSLSILKNSTELKNSLSSLSQTITAAYHKQEIAPDEALELYQEGLVQYPYSTELCLGLLGCYVKLSLDNPTKASKALALTIDMPLSESLNKKRDSLVQCLHANIDFIKENSYELRHKMDSTSKDTALLDPSLKLSFE